MGCVQGKCFRLGAAESQSPSSSRNVTPANCHVITSPSTLGSAAIASHGLLLQFSSLSLPGHYPDSPERENQDALLIETELMSNPNLHLFAVFDGHGLYGTACARFVRDRLPVLLTSDPTTLLSDPEKAFNTAFITINSELHNNSEIDDSMSGTTAIVVLVYGDLLYVANVGDSRAVSGIWNAENSVSAEELSSDQTPFRKDEKERVKKCGARVLTASQVEALSLADETADGHISDSELSTSDADEGDPPRLWVKDGMYPGTAFTRSVGDHTAEGIGVCAEPEVKVVRISPDHLFFVVASDGVFEFLTSQNVVDMVSRISDPREACSEIVAESYRRWLENESRTDDITIIVVHIKDLTESVSLESHQVIQTKIKDDRFGLRKLPEVSVDVDRNLSYVVPSPTHSLH
ncbi:hypothetical protein LUZ60_014084 [Juncus effusus]|nr:hypothetical protein LUZ60_014084 [Juncus effusus]